MGHIQIESYIVGEIEFKRARGMTRGAYPQLYLDFSCELWDYKGGSDQSQSVTLIQLEGNGYIAERELIGRLRSPEGPLLFKSFGERGNKRDITMALDLDYKRIKHIEEVRKGQDLSFTVEFYALMWLDGKFEKPRIDPLRFTVPQSEWIKVLEQLEYSKEILLEIPTPALADEASFRQAIERLERAQEDFHQGDYRECIVKCRIATEDFTKAAGIGKFGKAEWKTFLEQLGLSESKAEKYAAIVADTSSLLSLAPHSSVKLGETEERIEFRRIDAEYALVSTAALLSLLSKYCEGARPRLL